MRILVEPGRIKSGEILFDGQDTVSYTHLDVYKRQDKDCAHLL